MIREIRGKENRNHEKSSIDFISEPVLVWSHVINRRLLQPTLGSDPPLHLDSLRRDTDILGVAHRD